MRTRHVCLALILAALLGALATGPRAEQPPLGLTEEAVKSAKTPEERQAIADRSIERLKPSRFPELPRTVTEELERRGCTIPQAYVDRRPHNVISGRFRDRSHVDWAILCSRNRLSAILIFWAGSTHDVTTLGESPDEGWLQGIGDAKVEYSRVIATASEEAMQHNRRVYDAPRYPPIVHEGIEDAFAEKGSKVHYWYEGRWHQLPGGD